MPTRYKGTAEEVRALNTYIKLLRAATSTRRRIDTHQTANSLSYMQFGILEYLFHVGASPQKNIGAKHLTSKSNVVAVVDKLEAQGLVRRIRGEQDRRMVFIHLTDEGRDLIASLLPGHVAAITTELSVLTAEEQEELGRLCRKLGLAGEG